MRRLLVLLLLCGSLSAAEDWGAGKFLIGNWPGEGTGKPGEATGGFSFLPDLQGAVLIRKNHADYPAQSGRPAFRHDDLMIVSRDENCHKLRATYFDSEGHSILYSVTDASNGIVLVSDGGRESTRYRLTYTLTRPDEITLRFDIAPPGKDFGTYIEASARRLPDQQTAP